MTTDKRPAMTATAFANNPHNIAQRAAATHRLAELEIGRAHV